MYLGNQIVFEINYALRSLWIIFLTKFHDLPSLTMQVFFVQHCRSSIIIYFTNKTCVDRNTDDSSETIVTNT